MDFLCSAGVYSLTKYFDLHLITDIYYPFIKYAGLRNLVQRNEQLYSSGNAPTGGVALPFILLQVYIFLFYLRKKLYNINDFVEECHTVSAYLF